MPQLYKLTTSNIKEINKTIQQEFLVLSRNSLDTAGECDKIPTVARKNILVLLWSTAASGRDFLYGLSNYLKSRPAWNIRLLPTAEELSPDIVRSIRSGAFDGIVTDENMLAANPVLRVCKETSFVIFGTRPAKEEDKNVTYIQNDDRMIGRLGARHFLGLGNFRSFGFVPTVIPHVWSRDRAEGFAEELAKTGQTTEVFDKSSQHRSLTAWLRHLPKPCAVMAAWDCRAIEVVETAKKAGLDIPRQVAVLGVDNDELICGFTSPSISSIYPPHEENGFAAGKALDRLFAKTHGRGKPVILCSGAKIIQRESTAPLTPASHLILSALEFIQKNATRNIHVNDVVRHLKVSRRLADLRFREFQGESILETITRIRLDEVAKRLITTRLSASMIARSCGFDDVSYLGKLFRRKYGQTLQQWRKSHLPDDRPR